MGRSIPPPVFNSLPSKGALAGSAGSYQMVCLPFNCLSPFLSGWKTGDELENWFDRAGRIIVPAAPEPHAESAASESHAENAEGAEFEPHAENAEGAEFEPHAENAEPRPGEAGSVP